MIYLTEKEKLLDLYNILSSYASRPLLVPFFNVVHPSRYIQGRPFSEEPYFWGHLAFICLSLTNIWPRLKAKNFDDIAPFKGSHALLMPFFPYVYAYVELPNEEQRYLKRAMDCFSTYFKLLTQLNDKRSTGSKISGLWDINYPRFYSQAVHQEYIEYFNFLSAYDK